MCVIKQTPYLESLVGMTDAAMVRRLNGWMNARKDIKEEIAAMQECKSSYVVPLLAVAEPVWIVPFTGDFCLAMPSVAMVMPFYEKGDLYRLVIEENELEGRSKRMRNLNVAMFARDILMALDSIHAKGWIHRDIKPENVLVDDDKVVLADFGLACRARDETKRLTC
jgi:serine/threonine protein kinase